MGPSSHGLVMDDKNWYDLWDNVDKPVDITEMQSLEIARLRSQLEANSQKIEKVYIVRGYEIFVCHQGQVNMTKQKAEDGTILRDIDIKGARVVKYGKDGMRRSD